MDNKKNKGSAFPLASFRRPILNVRREQQVHSNTNHESSLESFQKIVFEQFHDLSSIDSDEFLSIDWVRKLLDAFDSSQEAFKVIMNNYKENISKPPLDRLISEFYDRSIKALDICNGTRDGIEKIRTWLSHLEIVGSALDPSRKTTGEGHFRRARKALMDLQLAMVVEKDNKSLFSHRNRSFGRPNKGKELQKRLPGHSRSLSWTVSQSWSASKQLQSIASSLVPPRSTEITTTGGAAAAVYAMSSVLTFMLWTLVAAIPCQDRGIQMHFPIPKQFGWASPLLSLHERIMEEYKKQGRRNNGLLKEVVAVEKCVNRLAGLFDSGEIGQEQKPEVFQAVEELLLVSEAFNNGLDPLEDRLKEVFRKIMSFKVENSGTSDVEQ